MDDKYIEIYKGKTEYDVQVRWTGDGEQHEVHGFDTLEEVTTFITNFYKNNCGVEKSGPSRGAHNPVCFCTRRFKSSPRYQFK